jgi:hypothetical protein
MEEHGAAAAGNAGTPVVVNFYNDIIEMIGACEAVPGHFARSFYRAVVISVRGVFRPGVVTADLPQRQQSSRCRPAVSPPPDADRMKFSAWRAPIALAFIGDNAGPADRRRNGSSSRNENGLAGLPRPPM